MKESGERLANPHARRYLPPMASRPSKSTGTRAARKTVGTASKGGATPVRGSARSGSRAADRRDASEFRAVMDEANRNLDDIERMLGSLV